MKYVVVSYIPFLDNKGGFYEVTNDAVNMVTSQTAFVLPPEGHVELLFSETFPVPEDEVDRKIVVPCFESNLAPAHIKTIFDRYDQSDSQE